MVWGRFHAFGNIGVDGVVGRCLLALLYIAGHVMASLAAGLISTVAINPFDVAKRCVRVFSVAPPVRVESGHLPI